MKKNAVEPAAAPSAEEFSNLVSLMALFSEVTNRMDDLQTDVNRQFLELIDEHKAEYAELQDKAAQAEKALEILTLRNPGWFSEKRKSIKTPYGSVKFHKSTKLEIGDEEKVILRLKLYARDNLAFTLPNFVKNRETLDIEALEKLTDAELLAFGITRLRKDNFSVEAAKVDMGKAVKEDAAKQAEAA